MKKSTIKKHNHIYPAFHMRKWEEFGGKIYDKNSKETRAIEPQKDFTLDYYYSLGKRDDKLENRISNFEQYIGLIIKRIDNETDKVFLSAKELELLKLYAVLCVNRQHFTSEVILDDESGIYRSNNYLFGTKTVKSQQDVVAVTEHIIEDFERMVKITDDISTLIDPWIIEPSYLHSTFTVGLHIVILRNDENCLCISDRCAIIENTMDSDHLYSYIPVSPKTAICLVKSKYYLTEKHLEDTKARFGRKYGNFVPDPYLSVIFENLEKLLICSYYLTKSNVHRFETFIENRTAKSVFIKINKIDNKIINQLNSIFCEDGNKILYCNIDALNQALTNKLDSRHITVSF